MDIVTYPSTLVQMTKYLFFVLSSTHIIMNYVNTVLLHFFWEQKYRFQGYRESGISIFWCLNIETFRVLNISTQHYIGPNTIFGRVHTYIHSWPRANDDV